MRLSPAAKLAPCQLHGEAGQATETMLFAPARERETVLTPAEVALKLAPRTAWSAPSCDHCTESFDAWPAWLVTMTKESASAAGAARATTKTETKRIRAGPRPSMETSLMFSASTLSGPERS